jgi:hypothetical protein
MPRAGGEIRGGKMGILLNNILHLDSLKDVKIRLTMPTKDGSYNPLELFKAGNTQELLGGLLWNYDKKKVYKEGQTAIGLVRIEGDRWLLFAIGEITKDLNVLDGVGYEYRSLDKYEKYFGRVIVRYKNPQGAANLIRDADTFINECEVERILDSEFDNDIFPGYENINVSWQELSRLVKKETWKTALENQKGVYLITDTQSGKMYVGSAYGENMILGRWLDYVNNGHGGNVKLKNLPFDDIKKNFRYSILDIFKSTIDDDRIIRREHWWMDALQTRKFGYNEPHIE